MNREERMVDTKWYHYHNENPKDKIAADCVIRAIATATGKSWVEVYDDLCAIGRKYGYMPNEVNTYARYLKQNGFIRMPEPRTRMNKKMTAEQFIKVANTEGAVIVAHLGSHHVAAIKDKQVWDIWNSSVCTMHAY